MNRPGSEIKEIARQGSYSAAATVQHLRPAPRPRPCAAARRGWYVAGAHALDQIGRTGASGGALRLLFLLSLLQGLALLVGIEGGYGRV